jgi:uncharacterized membrane protein
MTDDSPKMHGPARPFSTTQRLAASLGVGALAGIVTGLSAPWQAAPLLGWVAASLIWVGSVWASILRLDSAATSRYAGREDPHGAAADGLLLSASVAVLGAVVLGVVKSAQEHGSVKLLLLGAGVGAIVSSWGVVHTVFTLRYAALYYRGPDGGVNFNEDDKPTYVDFAYLAFTIGMTYQVSDTNLTSKAMRHTALRHALISYLLGTVIIAATINVAAGRARRGTDDPVRPRTGTSTRPTWTMTPGGR